MVTYCLIIHLLIYPWNNIIYLCFIGNSRFLAIFEYFLLAWIYLMIDWLLEAFAFNGAFNYFGLQHSHLGLRPHHLLVLLMHPYIYGSHTWMMDQSIYYYWSIYYMWCSTNIIYFPHVCLTFPSLDILSPCYCPCKYGTPS